MNSSVLLTHNRSLRTRGLIPAHRDSKHMAMVSLSTNRRPTGGIQTYTTSQDIACILPQLHIHSRDQVVPFQTRVSTWDAAPLMRRSHSKRSPNPNPNPNPSLITNTKDSLRHHKCNRVHNPNHIRCRIIRTIPKRNPNGQTVPCSRSKLNLRVSPRPCSRIHSYSTLSSSPLSNPSPSCPTLNRRPPSNPSPRRRARCTNSLMFNHSRRKHPLKLTPMPRYSRSHKGSRR
ncbi:hypothetical protein BJV74DRAFT_393429 [Russula compacta]|nr:hypothetical protein BJV74DRAFT_393429 [Russula compacta]